MAAENLKAKSSLAYNIYTIWLFTLSDVKTTILPQTAFGVFTALSGPLLTTNLSVHVGDVLSRLPTVLLWNWVNLLLFDVANQRLPASIIEDSVNKAWRPLPSGRISEVEARRLLLAMVPTCLLISWYLGGMTEAVTLMVLTWMYNDLGGSDEQYSIRNLINALGFMCYGSGSATVAVGYGQHSLNALAYEWIAIIGAVVFSTVSMQDMPDIPGDRAKGRRTLPLVHGEVSARFAIGLPIYAWSVFLPIYWDCHDDRRLMFIVVATVGAVLAGSYLSERNSGR